MLEKHLQVFSYIVKLAVAHQVIIHLIFCVLVNVNLLWAMIWMLVVLKMEKVPMDLDYYLK